VENLAVEQISHRGQINVWVGPDIQPLPWRHAYRPHVIEEDEWPNHAPRRRRQQPSNGKAATEIVRVPFDFELDRRSVDPRTFGL